jgi:hypothetical protein
MREFSRGWTADGGEVRGFVATRSKVGMVSEVVEVNGRQDALGSGLMRINTL